jgi:uncharacterized protein YciU (UPF0263 family)
VRFKATVEIELDASDEDAVDDLIAAAWMAGDPDDKLNATVWTRDIDLVQTEEV